AGRRDAEDHLLHDGRELVGHGELRLDAEEDEVEPARLIVAPAVRRRGRGDGRRPVAGLAARARLTGLAEVLLRVHPDNSDGMD
ncbi:hypothetical protein PV350_46390, partial [Streptomyces sp. PA03-6a]|nr:hypothetical protein [Streptomyces sp. PA03-6a]